jgi:hypothetical protein
MSADKTCLYPHCAVKMSTVFPFYHSLTTKKEIKCVSHISLAIHQTGLLS